MTAEPITIPASIHAKGYAAVQHGSDAGLSVRFWEEDQPITGGGSRRRVFVSIEAPGQKLTKVVRMATPHDFDRFPMQFAAFQAGEAYIGGTPLEQAPFIVKEVREALEKIDIKTLEQLAGVSDQNLLTLRLGDGRKLRDLARSFLERGPERAQIEARNAELIKQNADLQARLERIEALLAGGAGKARAQAKPDTKGEAD